MSKLNGVKTVDMANGEITKVVYDGAEYVKVDDKIGKLHDILRVTDADGGSLTIGDFHIVHAVDDDGDARYYDNNGHERCLYAYEVFRKVSAKSSEPTERLQVGDTVKVSIPASQRPAYGWGNVKNGDIGKVNAVFINSVTVEFPSHKSWTAQLTELVKVAEDGYVRVTDRKPKAGDYVKFTEDSFDVTAGSYYEIIGFDDDGDYEFKDDADDLNAAGVDVDNFEVYEKFGAKAETLKEENTALRVGDYAKVAAHVNHDGYAGAGDIVTLHSNEGGYYDFKVIKLADTGDYTLFNRDQLVKATDAEIAKALAPKFSVGDYVKLVKSTRGNEGKIAKIVGINVQSYDYEIELIPKTERHYGSYESWIVKATEEEVAEAKLAEQFTKLGRKPNEFKEGDVVRYSKGVTFIGEVADVGADLLGVRHGDGYYRATKKVDTVLIAPAESRVDHQ